MSTRIRVTKSSGNVFADLGLPDADLLLVKADLTMRISQIIRKRGLTQTKAAAVLGIDQPKVSALLRGQLDGFSIERLVRFLVALGCVIELKVKEGERRSGKPGASRRARVAVTV
jgi:predicted XRE-type DNA-binding protein